MSDTMEQGIISRWLKQVGEQIVSGDILAEVETDKATMELEAYEDGTLLHIGVAEKSVVRINDIIAIIGDAGTDITALMEPTCDQSAVTPGAVAVGMEAVTPQLETIPESIPLIDRFYASPLAKKIAKERGYDLTQLEGSGTAGRVIKKDLLYFDTIEQSLPIGNLLPWPDVHKDLPISAMRQAIAKRLTESKMEVPHFYLTVRINMNQLVALRPALNAHAPTKISINDLMVKATALSLVKHPKVNALCLKDKISSYQHAHIGVAIAVEGGLLVPVVRFADQKPIVEISKEVKIFAKKAAENKLMAKDCMGATCTISNLGMLGIESFTAIINPPAASILAIGALQQIPIVEDHQVVSAYMIKVTLSCDHRVIDGDVGARFLSTLKTFIEAPYSLLI